MDVSISEALYTSPLIVVIDSAKADRGRSSISFCILTSPNLYLSPSLTVNGLKILLITHIASTEFYNPKYIALLFYNFTTIFVVDIISLS